MPSHFIKIYKRGRHDPFSRPLALYYQVRIYAPDYWIASLSASVPSANLSGFNGVRSAISLRAAM